MFRMLGNKTELIRYVVTYIEDDVEMIEHCTSIEHIEEFLDMLKSKNIEFSVEEIDQRRNEWFDGLKFDSYDEALDVFKHGESVYNENVLVKNMLDSAQLRADIDYITVIMEV